MNLSKNTLGEILQSSIGEEVWSYVWPAVGSTLYMLAVTTVVTFGLGLALGIVLAVTDKDGIRPLPAFNAVLGAIVNVVRSFPSMILIILLLPLSRLVLHKTYGANACILALVGSCMPMLGRLIEGNLREVAKGKVEAAKAMGAGNWSIVFKVLLPEALPSIARSLTVAVIAVLGTTALAGSFGAGGLGDVAVRFGYNRFRTDVLIPTVVVLVIMVQGIQSAGDAISRSIMRRRYLV
jgi:ABC-type metal ion transport system, permease component